MLSLADSKMFLDKLGMGLGHGVNGVETRGDNEGDRGLRIPLILVSDDDDELDELQRRFVEDPGGDALRYFRRAN